jgi:predicted acetyltransferase
MTVDLTIAPLESKAVVGRLLEFNEYEFSRIDHRPIGLDGRYGYRYLDNYWDPSERRTPYLLHVEAELAGLALVVEWSGVTSFAEFLVLPKFRRRGVGIEAARLILRRHPGPWEITQVQGNDGATSFWRRAIPVPYEERIEADGHVAQTFMIDSQ